MNRLRVALDATPLLGPRAGVGVFTQELLARLASAGDLDVRAFAVTWRGRASLGDAVPAGVTVARRPMAARPLRWLWRTTGRPRIERWTGPVDVVHGPNYVVPPADAARVATVHDLGAVRFPELCTDDVLAWPGLLERAVSEGAWVHTVSEHVAEEVRAGFRVDPERVVAVPNGVRTAEHADASRGRALAGVERYVLALGTVEPRKNLPGLVAAFDAVAARLRDVHLVVAGADGWGVDGFDEAVDLSSSRERIRRLRSVPDHDREDLLAGAAVLAYPSIYEGFGLPPLEAMSAGVPVVTSDAGALPETVGDAAEVVPAGDRDALAQALERLLTDDERRAELIERGRRRVTRFSWDRTAEGLTALYRRAAAD